MFAMDSVPPYILWKEAIKNYLETCPPEQLYKVIGFHPAKFVSWFLKLGRSLDNSSSIPISPENERKVFLKQFRSSSPTFLKKPRCWLFLMICSGLISLRFCCCIIWLAVSIRSLCFFWALTAILTLMTASFVPVLTELNRERLLQSVR